MKAIILYFTNYVFVESLTILLIFSVDQSKYIITFTVIQCFKRIKDQEVRGVNIFHKH